MATYDLLESELRRQPLAASHNTIGQDRVSAAVAWHFTQAMLPEVVPMTRYPALREFSLQAEQLPEFMAAPHSDLTHHDKR